MNKEDKKYFSYMDLGDEVNPYSSYLDKNEISNITEWIDTGSMALNAIISGSLYKGIPCGRITQFAGPSMTGKTFFIQNLIANAQKMGKFVVVFDSENAIDADGAKGFGIDPKKVKYYPTTTIENTRNTIKKILKAYAEDIQAEKAEKGKFLFVIDSVAQMESELNESRIDKDSSASDMGTFAKAIKSLLKTCINWGKLTGTTFAITNEVYDDPSVMYPPLDKNMPGGKAAVYKPTVTVQLARKPQKDDDGKTIDKELSPLQKNYSGIILRGMTAKNRIIKQYLEAEVYLSFTRGLDKYYGLLELMKGLGVVVLEGKTYKDYEGNSLGYYKNWRKDSKVWDRLLPVLESRIAPAWAYSSNELEQMELDGDEDFDEDDELKKSTNPLDILKDMKKQVSNKIDKLEEDENDD